jgi:hypothetical protein
VVVSDVSTFLIYRPELHTGQYVVYGGLFRPF